MKRLTKLNRDEEVKAIIYLAEKGIDYNVIHYITNFFAMEIPVCDITVNSEEIETELFYYLYPYFD